MNEYTRREEIRWTLVTVLVLVLAVATGIYLLVTAKGPLLLDKDTIFQANYAAKKAEEATKEFQGCKRTLTGANGLKQASADLQSDVTRAKERQKTTLAEKNKGKKEGDKDWVTEDKVPIKILWSGAAPAHKLAGLFGPCHEEATRLTGARADAEAGWAKLAEAAKVPAPKVDDPNVTLDFATKLGAVPFDVLEKQLNDASTKLDETENAAKDVAKDKEENARVIGVVPEGLFPRGVAIGVGVGVSLIALIISYLSLRSASNRRARILVGLRRFANTPEAGLQAAAIVRLAAHHNGGEPGMVVGSALGGLFAALSSRMAEPKPDFYLADLFVAGAAGGLLLGLALQWVVRSASGYRRWRDRVKELGEIEKPTIPVVLVLGGVTQGLEKQFMRYFEGLPIADAAVVVQKLAAQAEDQILMAAMAAGEQSVNAIPAPQAPMAPQAPQQPQQAQPGPWGGR